MAVFEILKIYFKKDMERKMSIDDTCGDMFEWWRRKI